MVDVIILILWSSVDPPIMVTRSYQEQDVYQSVRFDECSSNLNSPFEIVMMIWKAVLICLGVYKAIQTWDLPSDLAEVKHFFLAIYNVSVVGGAMYFFSFYGATSAGAFIIMRCLGIFISSTLPILIIMIPKFLAISYKKITGKDLWTMMVSRKSARNVSQSPHHSYSGKRVIQSVSDRSKALFHSEIVVQKHSLAPYSTKDGNWADNNESPSNKHEIEMMLKDISGDDHDEPLAKTNNDLVDETKQNENDVISLRTKSTMMGNESKESSSNKISPKIVQVTSAKEESNSKKMSPKIVPVTTAVLKDVTIVDTTTFVVSLRNV